MMILVTVFSVRSPRRRFIVVIIAVINCARHFYTIGMHFNGIFLPGKRDKSRPTDNIGRFCGRLSCPHYFRRPDTAPPFRSFSETCSWEHMCCESSSTCWEHPREYLLCERNRLDCRRIVVWWQSARRQSASWRWLSNVSEILASRFECGLFWLNF